MKKVKLGEVLSLKKGKKATVLAEQTTLSQRYIQIDDLRNNNNLKFTESLNMTEALPDDILIAWDGANAGTVGYGLSGAVGSTITVLKKNERYKEKIISDYLGVFLESKSQYLRDHSTGATIPHLNKNILLDLQLELLGIEEQENIICILNTIKRLITKRKLQLDELNLLVKSRFNEMFGDFYTTLFPKYKIGEKFEVSSGSTPSRDNKLYWDSGTINWVKTTEVINREITETEEKITKFALENTSLKLFPVDTILIAMYGQGQTRGRSAILKVESTSNQACGAIFQNKIDNPVFIWHQLMLRYSELRELGRGGNQPNLNGQLIKNFELIFPPLSLQNEFSDFVAQVDKSQLAIQKSLEELETLKKSLMQEYFG
ncbi:MULTISPECIES: restriction endonuclease subunit S [Streptococcus]|uniref:restriction endonuclease subunit S n=2 Tax=Streptococcus TaxID=1301 RepID=UPI0014194146|nr:MULTISPECIES: restriction endonuclease subunit S [Streptococcus]NIB63487.1 restriction endonuclease subunit S [Streptococcus pseudopneumoniae]